MADHLRRNSARGFEDDLRRFILRMSRAVSGVIAEGREYAARTVGKDSVLAGAAGAAGLDSSHRGLQRVQRPKDVEIPRASSSAPSWGHTKRSRGLP